MIADVFGLKWYDLVNHPGDHAADPERDYKIPTAMSDEDFRAVVGKHCSSRVIERIAIGATGRGVAPNESTLPNDSEEVVREQYRRSIYFMTAKLNSKGMMRAMQHVLALCDDPEFCILEVTKEDTEWQKEKQPMAAEQLLSEQTADMKVDM